MVRPRLEVAGVFRAHGAEYLSACGPISPARQRVLHDITACRTAELGGHVERCADCGFERNAYNSCRNRHCPKCQARASAEWLEARARELLPVEYFHVVFTLPEELAAWALQNKKVLYGILFRSSAETLKQIVAAPIHLGDEIGFVSVLHTWGQNLHHHPHVHCIVPGGGLSAGRTEWISCPRGFFLPVRVLSQVFRGKFLAYVREAFTRGRLRFQGALASLSEPRAFASLLSRVASKPWVVYAKRPFGGPEQVLKYLARYTHRVAISNHRLISLEGGVVSFRWKDYAHASRPRTMSLDAVEFIRRFLLHTLPKGFVRIRHFGWLANRCRAPLLDRCRELLRAPVSPSQVSVEASGSGPPACPVCGSTRLMRAGRIRPRALQATRPAGIDSSWSGRHPRPDRSDPPVGPVCLEAPFILTQERGTIHAIR